MPRNRLASFRASIVQPGGTGAFLEGDQESPLYQELVKEEGVFWIFMRDLVREARTSIRKTQLDQNVLDKMAVQKENIMKAIKSLPELKEYAFPEVKDKVCGTKNHNEGITEFDIERRDAADIVTVEDNPATEPSDRTRKAKKTHVRKTYYVTINGKKFKVEHSFVDLKTDDVLKDKNVDDESGIQVFTNIAFPAFANTKDHVFYGAWNIAEAIGEVMVDKNKRSLTEVIKIRDLILKKTAEITRELDDIEREKKIAEKLRRDYEEKLAHIKAIEQKHVAINI